jgi:hypothetical protein
MNTINFQCLVKTRRGTKLLSPLRDNIHDKLADVFHVIDTLLFESVLLVKQLFRDWLTTTVYKLVECLPGDRYISVPQGSNATTKASSIFGQELRKFETGASGVLRRAGNGRGSF